jgi:hypothetical protein
MEVVLGILVLVGWVTAIVLNALKGKYVFSALAVFGSLWALIGAIRLAKPNSWWARHRYAPQRDPERPSSYDKLARSIDRYEHRPWPLRQTYVPVPES